MTWSATSAGRSTSAASCSARCWLTSTRAACHADQCPDTNAHNDNADTYTTLDSHPAIIETGIIATQNTVSHPLTRRMSVGSPCTEAHNDLIAVISPPRTGRRGPQVGVVHRVVQATN